jgi:hypothetical protein
MSTSYGIATVAFTGFSSMTFNTVNDEILFPDFHWGYKISCFLPRRTVKLANGTKQRLSKKERSSLLTLSRKWNKYRGWKQKRPYRTLREENFC